ncbi:MAG: ribosome biogenesis GTPase Der [Acidiferrobacteraceae bacterium]|nr:ribosome biogenesis GTPase Der [Acidiferrobacteraceae bacterium]
MLPIVTILGRPNVGKSTLFNRLVRSNKSLVDDQAGVTRDRMYAKANLNGNDYLFVDTGGLGATEDILHEEVHEQVEIAIEESDAIILVVDFNGGRLGVDRDIAARLRLVSQPLLLAVNKTEGREKNSAVAEFHELALGDPIAISARTGSGISELTQELCNCVPSKNVEREDERPSLAVIGRPNVGKSTLVNSLAKCKRVIVADVPGTTRDMISVPIDWPGWPITVIDTAGVRRKSRVKEVIEQYSIVKTFQAVSASSVALLLLDATEGIVEQDKTIAGLVLHSGRSIVVIVNKWDKLSKYEKRLFNRSLSLSFSFLPKHEAVRISALRGTGISNVMQASQRAHESAIVDLPTGKLNRFLAEAIDRHPPARLRGRAVNLKFAHQGGRNPPVVVIHGNLSNSLSPGYRRYLSNYFAEAFSLIGARIRIEVRASANPYA